MEQPEFRAAQRQLLWFTFGATSLLVRLKFFKAHRSKIEMFVGIPTYLKYDVFAMNYFVYFKTDFYPCLVCCERLLQCPDSLCKQNCGIILLKQPWVIDQNLMTCFWHVCSGRSMLRS